MPDRLHDTRAGEPLALTWHIDLDYLTLARFAQLVVERGLEHIVETSWATERMTLEGLFDHAVSTLRDRHERAAVLDLAGEVGDACLVHLSLGRGRARLRCAARTVDALSAAKAWLQARYPIAKPADEQRVPISFWTSGDRTGRRISRTVAVPTWDEVADNYPEAVASALADLVGRRLDDEHAGRLVLWHGPPGTGKTHALRALAWEWRSWCEFHYITDPEVFFGSTPRYMLDVLLDEDADDSRWRLLILEDTGELLAVDAKHQTGQGLSRLLNVVDGLIGQGLRVIVLVTTNEEVRSLHPAVARPGRCLGQIEFGALSVDEADRWLEQRGRRRRGAPRTLASLFGEGDDAQPSKTPRVGFHAR